MNRLNNFPTDEDLRFFLQDVAKREKLVNVWEQEIANKSKFDFAQIKQDVQTGNEAAFTPFFQKNYHKLYYSLIGKIKSKEKTEDIVMEAIYKFYNRFIVQDKPIPDNASGYLYRTANNLWNDSFKKEIFDEMEDTKEPIQIDHVTLKEEQGNRELMNTALQLAWDGLSLRKQNLIQDKWINQLTTAELMKKYGFGTPAVLYATLSTCMRKLRDGGNDFLNDLLKQ